MRIVTNEFKFGRIQRREMETPTEGEPERKHKSRHSHRRSGSSATEGRDGDALATAEEGEVAPRRHRSKPAEESGAVEPSGEHRRQKHRSSTPIEGEASADIDANPEGIRESAVPSEHRRRKHRSSRREEDPIAGSGDGMVENIGEDTKIAAPEDSTHRRRRHHSSKGEVVDGDLAAVVESSGDAGGGDGHKSRRKHRSHKDGEKEKEKDGGEVSAHRSRLRSHRTEREQGDSSDASMIDRDRIGSGGKENTENVESEMDDASSKEDTALLKAAQGTGKDKEKALPVPPIKPKLQSQVSQVTRNRNFVMPAYIPFEEMVLDELLEEPDAIVDTGMDQEATSQKHHKIYVQNASTGRFHAYNYSHLAQSDSEDEDRGDNLGGTDGKNENDSRNSFNGLNLFVGLLAGSVSSFFLFCQGILAGMCLLQVVLIYASWDTAVLTTFPPSGYLSWLSWYGPIASTFQRLLFVFSALSVIGAVDKCARTSFDRSLSFIHNFRFVMNITAAFLYLLCLVSILLSAPIDDIFSYASLRVPGWYENTSDVTLMFLAQLFIWHIFNFVRCGCALLGWLLSVVGVSEWQS